MENIYAKKYRTVGLTMFVVSIGLLIMRIISYYVQVAMLDVKMDEAWLELVFDALFSIPVQLGLLFLLPFLMYKFILKDSPKEVLGFSNYRKCNIWACLLTVPLGAVIIFVTMGASVIWQVILQIMGFTPSSGGELPATFNGGYFVISVALTALLPCICEEFTNRGGLLTVMRSSFPNGKTILLIGLAFGLFHQNITQVFYASLLGALMAYLVLETGSIFPSMILHFMNNFMSLYLDNATTYGWGFMGGMYDFIENSSFIAVTSALALCCLAAYGLLVAITFVCRRDKRKDFYLELNTACAASGFKVTMRDNIFFYGAIAVTAVSTFLTFLFGL